MKIGCSVLLSVFIYSIVICEASFDPTPTLPRNPAQALAIFKVIRMNYIIQKEIKLWIVLWWNTGRRFTAAKLRLPPTAVKKKQTSQLFVFN